MEPNGQMSSVVQVGQVKRQDGRIYLEIEEPYRPALKQLQHFGYVQVLWWFDRSQDSDSRQVLQSKPPFGDNVPMTGVFASRWPERPNPIALTTTQVLRVNYEEGTVDVGKIDAFDGSPIVDLKPYFPVCDRVKAAKVPPWIAHWPEWMPEKGTGLPQADRKHDQRARE
jgi:tRNA-Thr(GGU) m(6)t(6)A37 methyltransferase TsaA